MPKLKTEPTAIIWAVWTALNAIQTAAIDMPDWAHTVILVATAALGAFINRSQVTPAAQKTPKTPEQLPLPVASPTASEAPTSPDVTSPWRKRPRRKP